MERKNYNQEYPTVGWDSELKEIDFPRHAKTEGFHDDYTSLTENIKWSLLSDERNMNKRKHMEEKSH